LAVHDDVVSVVTSLWQTPNFQARVRLSALVIGQLAAHVAESNAADRERIVKQAEEFMNTALEPFELHRHKGRMMGPEGIAWRQRAIAEHARVRWLAGIDPPPEDELVQLWTQAVADFETMGHAFETARSQARLAAILAGAGRTSEARPVADA